MQQPPPPQQLKPTNEYDMITYRYREMNSDEIAEKYGEAWRNVDPQQFFNSRLFKSNHFNSDDPPVSPTYDEEREFDVGYNIHSDFFHETEYEESKYRSPNPSDNEEEDIDGKKFTHRNQLKYDENELKKHDEYNDKQNKIHMHNF